MGTTLEDITIAPADTVTDPVQRLSIRRPQATSRRATMVTAAAVAAGALLVDIVTKTIAVEVLAAGPAHVWILHLRLVANRGILMGMIALPIWLITLVSIVVVAVAARAVWRNGAPSSIAYALLSAGAVGNLIDRFLQRPEFPPNAVVDWLSFGGMTFNLADVFLVAAVLLLVKQQPTTVEAALT